MENRTHDPKSMSRPPVSPPIMLIVNDALATIPTRHHKVDRSRILDPSLAWHGEASADPQNVLTPTYYL